MKIIQEFKAFAVKGNVMDLAVAVIIGAAFGKIISSFVDNILMPVIGMFLRGANYKDLVIKIGEAEIRYGIFIGAVIDFIIIALILFLMIKAMNSMYKKEAAAPSAPAPPTKDQQLLTEIRDLLKQKP